MMARRPEFFMALAACAALLPFLYAFGFCFPYGDDFDDVTRAMFFCDLPGAVYEVGREWLTWGGRYASRFLAVFFARAAQTPWLNGLVCCAVFCSWGVAACLLARSAMLSPGKSAFFAIFALLLTGACHWQPANFYLYTDALTIALQFSVYVCFLAAAIKLSRKAENWRATLLTGAVAIGMYEHAAIAVMLTFFVICMLAFAGFWQKTEAGGFWRRIRLTLLAAGFRPFLWLFLVFLCLFLFSFLAPGNFQRMLARPVAPEQRLLQLANFRHEWPGLLAGFVASRWFAAATLLSLWLAALTGAGRRQFFPIPWWIISLAIAISYLIFSAGVVFLHALGEAPISSGPKVPASLAAYGALALGLALLPIWPRIIDLSRLKRTAALLLPPVLLVLAASSPNFLRIYTNAANGRFLVYGDFMRFRDGYLREIGEKAAEKSPSLPFGLLGELQDSNARKLRPDPALPAVEVQKWSQPVFPYDLAEGLKPKGNMWPNTWAARMYGLRSIGARPASPMEALALVWAGEALELNIPPALASMSGAWLVPAQGGPNATFFNLWLVLETEESLPDVMALLPSPITPWRLLPIPVQQFLNAELVEQRQLRNGFLAGLASQKIYFPPAPPVHGRYHAFPLTWLEKSTPWPATVIFLSLAGGACHRLEPRM